MRRKIARVVKIYINERAGAPRGEVLSGRKTTPDCAIVTENWRLTLIFDWDSRCAVRLPWIQKRYLMNEVPSSVRLEKKESKSKFVNQHFIFFAHFNTSV